MNKHSLDILEFNKIIELLKGKCATVLGQEVIDKISPIYNKELVKIYLNEVEEMKTLLDREGSIPFRQIYDVRVNLSHSKIGQVLNAEELVKVSTTFKSITGLFNFLSNTNSPLLNREINKFVDFTKLWSEIDRCVDFDGKIFDNASGNLNKIRTEIRMTELRIKDKINQIATGSKYKTYLSDPIVTIRNGRYCVPVKAEYKSQVPGIVHDSSGSGQTLFIEPGLIVDMGNKLKDAYGRERDEIYKILGDLSKLVGEYGDSGLVALETVANLDSIYAKALLAYDYKGNKPKINDTGYINILNGRHPLLYLKNKDAVPIDVNLGKKFNCLLITGPNTGGKTVTLKTVGLLCLMTMCGMFIPAEKDSEISLFKEIFTDIGDEQSIEQSLSTFSAHMKNIVSICEESSKNSLILLDELGAGTDPIEGSALARAIIEDLMAKECDLIATTHYGELKNFAYITDGIENASVEFDTVSLKPTYKLLIGIPGSSNAFHIAKRMGISDSVIKRAEEAQNKEKNAGQEIIEKIEEVHREANKDRIEAAKRLREIEDIKAEFADKLARLEKREATIEDKIKKRANKVIKEYSNKIGETLEALRKTESENEERQSLKRDLNKLVEGFEFEIKRPMKAPEKIEDRPALTSVAPGDRVYVKSLSMVGDVEEYINDNKIIVMVGAMKMTMALSNLAEAKEEPKKKINTSANLSLNKARNFKPELRLLGFRVEEAILELDKFLDNAIAANAESFRIVHGKGTGALRSAVHLYLSENPSVKSYETCDPSEGGDGATKVYL